MPKALTVSIVIPAHNEARHIKACLDSIARQSVAPLEVILVDNNSTDQTAVLAREYPFVRVVRAQQQGIVFARNMGFDAAKGDIIGRIDADIVLPTDWVEYVSRFYSDARHRNQAWTSRGVFANIVFKRLFTTGYEWLAFQFNWLLLGHYTLWGSSMALLPAQWQAVRENIHLRNDIHEDLDLALHLRAEGYGITYDRALPVTARLSHVHPNRSVLWSYLQLWPRTLRLHGKWTWPICWFFGAFCAYLCVYALLIVARLFSVRPKMKHQLYS